ncbi:MAG: hypothetical protein J6S49_04820 [Erysipelotrichaceae bacterium]|nr:hypothetical protein [Erysipelotrichaceae bacterium]
MFWIKENIANIVVLSMVFALLYMSESSIIKARRTGSSTCSCGRNCANCALACAHNQANRR